MLSCASNSCCDAAVIGGITGLTTGLAAVIFIRRRHGKWRRLWLLLLVPIWLALGLYSGFGVRGCYVLSLAAGLAVILVPLLFIFIDRSARTIGSKGPG
jgi:hypothetical protein